MSTAAVYCEFKYLSVGQRVAVDSSVVAVHLRAENVYTFSRKAKDNWQLSAHGKKCLTAANSARWNLVGRCNAGANTNWDGSREINQIQVLLTFMNIAT